MSPGIRTQPPTHRLSMLYIIALSTVALLAVLGQIVIQSALQQQSSDALVINVAGRQRMLSQRLSKAALTLVVFSDTQDRQQNSNELRAVVTLWKRSQEGLQHGDVSLGLPGNNSPMIQHLFAEIKPEYQTMLRASNTLLSLANPPGTHVHAVSSAAFLPSIHLILGAQANFLVGMDKIVTQYQQEAEEHVTRLKLIELTLFGLTLLVLLLEGLFVFRPAVGHLQQTFEDLLQANQRASRADMTRKRAERILALNDALIAQQEHKPHVRIVSVGYYQVRDKDGSYHNVYQQEIEHQQVFICECLQYQEQKICAHSLTASALYMVSR